MAVLISLLATVGVTLLLVALLIIPHEFGHYGAARIFGIRPKSFSLGVGKTLFKKEIHGTEFTFKLLPIGGSIVIDDDDEKFINLGTVRRCIIIAAGAFMNFLTAVVVVLLIALFFTPEIPTMQVAQIYDKAIEQGYGVGIEKGDTLIKVDDHSIATLYDMTYYLALQGKDTFDFEVERLGERLVISDVKLNMDDVDGIVGAEIGTTCSFYSDPPTFFKSMKYSVNFMRSLFSMVWSSFKALFTGKVPITAMSSIVGVGNIVSEQVGKEYAGLLILAILGMVSISLTVVNLLPIPALDGGHILVMIIEGVSGKKVNEKALKVVSRIFYIAISILSLGLVIMDVLKIFKII